MRALRNRLTDLLLAALRSSEGEVALSLFAAACRLAEKRGSRSVPVTALPASLPWRGKEVGTILTEEPALLRERGGDGGGVLEVAPAFPEEVAAISARVRLFSRVVEQTRVWRSHPEDLSAALRQAAVLCGAGLFFECHEFLEDFWRRERDPETRRFLQGLIQIVVAFSHLEDGNISGARRLLREGREKIERVPATFWDVDVARFAEGVRACEEHLATRGEGGPWREWVPPLRIVSPVPFGGR